MDIIAILKKLKEIEADREYTKKSRMVILGAEYHKKPISPWRFLTDTIQFGSGIALAWLLILIILGGFSGEEFTPSGVELRSLRAEAEAIDVQIELVDLKLDQAVLSQKPEIAPRETPGSGAGGQVPQTEGGKAATAEPALDEILEALSQ